MNTPFTASNGDTVETRPGGDLVVKSGNYTEWVEPFAVDALREYFQHRRDVELGRWRDPENPDHLVYQCDPYVQGYRRIAVVNESDMTSVHTFSEGAEKGSSDPKALTAQRYFAAHPEPKPWESAKHEEVWEITAHGDTGPALATTAHDYGSYLAFQVANGNLISTEVVTAGRRIWPTEGSDDE